MPACSELGITFVPFSPLARGLITGKLNIDELGSNDFRKTLPRYQKAHEDNNKHLSIGLADIASAKQCTPAQLALAWVLAQGENIVPIPGTKKRNYLMENAGSVDVVITKDDINRIETLLATYPDTGERYNADNQKYVDMEV